MEKIRHIPKKIYIYTVLAVFFVIGCILGYMYTQDNTLRRHAEQDLEAISVKTVPKNVTFSQTGKGVHVGVDTQTDTKYIQLDKGTEVEYEQYTDKDGKKINFYTPKTE